MDRNRTEERHASKGVISTSSSREGRKTRIRRGFHGRGNRGKRSQGSIMEPVSEESPRTRQYWIQSNKSPVGIYMRETHQLDKRDDQKWIPPNRSENSQGGSNKKTREARLLQAKGIQSDLAYQLNIQGSREGSNDQDNQRTRGNQPATQETNRIQRKKINDG
jgi:hypothetical protein